MRSRTFLGTFPGGARITNGNFVEAEIVLLLEPVLAQLRCDLGWIKIAYPRFTQRSSTCGDASKVCSATFRKVRERFRIVEYDL
jgi:hypothetical protein